MKDLTEYLRGVLDEFEGEPIPFQLHGHIRALTEICETLMGAVDVIAEPIPESIHTSEVELLQTQAARQAKVRVGEILEGKK